VSDEIAYMTALEVRAAIAAKDLSPVEAAEATLAHATGLEPKLNAFAEMTPEVALAAARQAEKRLMAGEATGLLEGVPVSVKDLVPMKDVKWTMGSRVMADNVADFDAPSVRRLREHGAVIIGKTTTSEFGCKAVGDSPLHGITHNPWNLDKTPGGSSAGGAASVAAGTTPLALGTDGGGSIRIPASFCGLVGIKANFARVPTYPVSATMTLSHQCPMARTVRDAALMLTALAGHDRQDPFSVAEPVPDFLGACEASVTGMKIAWSPTLGYARPLPEVVEICAGAAKAFEDMGCAVEQVETVMDDPVDIWNAEFYAGVGTRLKETMEKTPELLDPTVLAMLKESLDMDIEDYIANVFRRYEFREATRLFFENYDLLLSPALPVPALDAGTDMPTGMPDDRNAVSWTYYTYPFNLSGQPAASVPAGFTAGGLPVGLQMVSKINREVDIFRAAAALEEARPWADARPSLT
jgi:Asp-tRNA(Asn)/Glu-tRNA(Gln) amidotransferase A subunit family amidase